MAITDTTILAATLYGPIITLLIHTAADPRIGRFLAEIRLLRYLRFFTSVLISRLLFEILFVYIPPFTQPLPEGYLSIRPSLEILYTSLLIVVLYLTVRGLRELEKAMDR